MVIEIQSLTKSYANGKGIFDVSFSFPQGEVFGFLGPNGAGKTTTIRHLMGFIKPTSGFARIDGLDCWDQASEIHKRLGYVPGEIAFLEHMTGLQFLKFLGDLRGSNDLKRQKLLIERFELEGERKIKKMSKGMKQKVALIAAFMHDPAVLILDEPTSGLDPLMQKRFVELILEERDRGKTILMSSHMFDEVDRTCERVAIIREGRIMAVEDIAQLKASLSKSFLVTVADQEDIKKIQASGLDYHLTDKNKVEIRISGEYERMLRTLAECSVTSLDASAQTLEQIFMRYYGKGER